MTANGARCRFPDEGGVYDYQFSQDTGRWVKWMDTVEHTPINTKLDYDVRVTFDWSTDGYLKGFSTTLTQGANTVTIPRQSTPNQA